MQSDTVEANLPSMRIAPRGTMSMPSVRFLAVFQLAVRHLMYHCIQTLTDVVFHSLLRPRIKRLICDFPQIHINVKTTLPTAYTEPDSTGDMRSRDSLRHQLAEVNGQHTADKLHHNDVVCLNLLPHRDCTPSQEYV